MVQIILRDDDLNINCNHKDLDIFFEASKHYDEVVISVVPFPCSQSETGSNNNIDLDFSVNNSFIKKARTLLKHKNVTLSMHGVRHKGYGEFKDEIEFSEIKRAKETIEKIFGVNVQTFTPPNNILSKKNFYKIVDAGFKRIFTAFSNWPNERPLRFCYFDHFLRSSFLALIGKKERRIIRKLKYKNTEEYPSFIAYTPKDLKNLIDNIIKSNLKPEDTIIIGTHFWELWRTNSDELLSLPNLIRCKIH
tara:strand:- start:307 stop:1053 length:747 start_codon:yes stop_codon:yes gene_type:complete